MQGSDFSKSATYIKKIKFVFLVILQCTNMMVEFSTIKLLLLLFHLFSALRAVMIFMPEAIH